MIGLFDIASKDQSVLFLGQIFGVVSPGVLSPSSAPMLMGTLFKVFNTSILTLGAFIVVYTTVVGLLKTAHEGEFLGKQWNSLWVPLRTVFGIAALFPLPTGYSAIQVVFMWFILQGVGAADTLWKAVVQNTVVAGSPTGAQASDINDDSIDTNLKNLFKGLVCQADAARASADLYPEGTTSNYPIKYYCNTFSSSDWCSDTYSNDSGMTVASYTSSLDSDASVNKYEIGPHGDDSSGLCGTLTYCDESAKCDTTDTNYSKVSCDLCRTQKQVLTQAIPVLSSIAEDVVNTDDQYIAEMVQAQDLYTDKNYSTPDWISNYCGTAYPDSDPIGSCVLTVSSGSSTGDKRIISADASIGSAGSSLMTSIYWPYSIKSYVSTGGVSTADSTVNFITAIKRLYSVALKQTMILNADVTSSSNEDWVANSVDEGWIYSGAYFYSVVKQTQKNIDVTLPVFNATNITGGTMSGYRNNITAAGELLAQIEADAASESSVSSSAANDDGESVNLPSQMSGVSTQLENISKNTLEDFQESLQSEDNFLNPIIGIGDFGYKLMKKIMDGYWIIASIIFGLGLLASVSVMVFGSGMTVNPFGEALKLVWGYVSPFILLVLGGLYAVGAILGIYVPFIPFMVFAMGAIGWMLATVEAMVAAPIVALGVLSPGGQSEMFGRAEPALMLILNLFLRPSLMVMGLMAATLVSVPVTYLVQTAFKLSLSNLGTSFGLFEALIVISVYASFIVTIIGKCYSLIYVIPERVLTWIGGPAVQYGEAEALQAAKQAVEGGAQGVTGAQKESTGSVLGGTLATVQAARAKYKKGGANISGGVNNDEK